MSAIGAGTARQLAALVQQSRQQRFAGAEAEEARAFQDVEAAEQRAFQDRETAEQRAFQDRETEEQRGFARETREDQQRFARDTREDQQRFRRGTREDQQRFRRDLLADEQEFAREAGERQFQREQILQEQQGEQALQRQNVAVDGQLAVQDRIAERQAEQFEREQKAREAERRRIREEQEELARTAIAARQAKLAANREALRKVGPLQGRSQEIERILNTNLSDVDIQLADRRATSAMSRVGEAATDFAAELIERQTERIQENEALGASIQLELEQIIGDTGNALFELPPSERGGGTFNPSAPSQTAFLFTGQGEREGEREGERGGEGTGASEPLRRAAINFADRVVRGIDSLMPQGEDRGKVQAALRDLVLLTGTDASLSAGVIEEKIGTLGDLLGGDEIGLTVAQQVLTQFNSLVGNEFVRDRLSDVDRIESNTSQLRDVIGKMRSNVGNGARLNALIGQLKAVAAAGGPEEIEATMDRIFGSLPPRLRDEFANRLNGHMSRLESALQESERLAERRAGLLAEQGEIDRRIDEKLTELGLQSNEEVLDLLRQSDPQTVLLLLQEGGL